MATRMFEVQQKIFSALESDKELKKSIKGIYDYVPEKTKFPYVTFGPMISNSEKTKTDEGEKLNFTLDVWSESKGRRESVLIITLIEKILEVEFELDSALVINQQVISREVAEEAYGLYHAFLELEIQIEWEE